MVLVSQENQCNATTQRQRQRQRAVAVASACLNPNCEARQHKRRLCCWLPDTTNSKKMPVPSLCRLVVEDDALGVSGCVGIRRIQSEKAVTMRHARRHRNGTSVTMKWVEGGRRRKVCALSLIHI